MFICMCYTNRHTKKPVLTCNHMHSNMYIRMYVLAHLHKFMFTVLVTLYAEQHIRVKNSKKVKHFFLKHDLS